MFSNLKRQDGEKVLIQVSLVKNQSSLKIYFSMSIKDLAGLVKREKRLVFGLILLSQSDKIYAKNSVVDPNTLNLDPDQGFWPNLYPDPG